MSDLEAQLQDGVKEQLPPDVEARIAAMTISREPPAQLVATLDRQRKDADALGDDADKKTARQSYQQALTRLANEAATRSLLRALYSDRQLEEQLTWFWMNHFNVFQGKANLRAMVGDFEDCHPPSAVFATCPAATVRHPAMLRYLDNSVMPSIGSMRTCPRVDGAAHTRRQWRLYAKRRRSWLAHRSRHQSNRQGSECAPELQQQYVRDGLFEFNLNRHDYGDKEFLG
jgi:hypothetical protein